uniref:Uncharacterized protein n=1 Tax=Leptospira ellisii TaxID=2023197 RepID=A0A2N0BAT0_9LEPT|nr:hypothetical protein CH379_06855 [Leptospira ellisii]
MSHFFRNINRQTSDKTAQEQVFPKNGFTKFRKTNIYFELFEGSYRSKNALFHKFRIPAFYVVLIILLAYLRKSLNSCGKSVGNFFLNFCLIKIAWWIERGIE